MYAIFQKPGTTKEIKGTKFIHTSTVIKIPKQTLGNSILVFKHSCDGLARLIGYELKDIILDETEISIKLGNKSIKPISELQELNDLWERVTEASKRILSPFGCSDWCIEIEVFEESKQFADVNIEI